MHIFKKLKQIFFDDLSTFYKMIELIGVVAGLMTALSSIPDFGLKIPPTIIYFAFTLLIACAIILVFRIYLNHISHPLVRKFIKGKANRIDKKLLKFGLPEARKNQICLEIIFRSNYEEECYEILEEIFPIFPLTDATKLELFLKEIGRGNETAFKIDDSLFKKIFEQLTKVENQIIQDNVRSFIQQTHDLTTRIGAIRVSPVWNKNVESELLKIIEAYAVPKPVFAATVEALGNLKSAKSIELFQKFYNQWDDAIRNKMLMVASNIEHDAQDFFQQATLFSNSGDQVRGEAMQLLVKNPEDREKARKCLCKILIDREERAVVRSQAAFYLART